jgi:hypothetical protein
MGLKTIEIQSNVPGLVRITHGLKASVTPGHAF